MAHKYTEEQAEFIRTNAKGITSIELTEKFNKHFSLVLVNSQIRAYMKNHGITNGVNTRFDKGHMPANPILKGQRISMMTEFKKGNKPHNYLPVGFERVNGDDYVDIKIADPNKWKGKHILIWEAHNGALPKGHVVIFGDSDNRNFDINNLICVSRKQLARLNQNNLIQKHAELTRSGVIVADIISKIAQRKKA